MNGSHGGFSPILRNVFLFPYMSLFNQVILFIMVCSATNFFFYGNTRSYIYNLVNKNDNNISKAILDYISTIFFRVLASLKKQTFFSSLGQFFWQRCQKNRPFDRNYRLL